MRAKARHVCLTQLSTLKSQLAFFLLSQSLKNCVALLCRRDRVGDIPKIICRVFSNDTGRTPFQVASRFRRLCAIQLHDFLATPSTFPFLITPCSETRHPPLTNQLLREDGSRWQTNATFFHPWTHTRNLPR